MRVSLNNNRMLLIFSIRNVIILETLLISYNYYRHVSIIGWMSVKIDGLLEKLSLSLVTNMPS